MMDLSLDGEHSYALEKSPRENCEFYLDYDGFEKDSRVCVPRKKNCVRMSHFFSFDLGRTSCVEMY